MYENMLAAESTTSSHQGYTPLLEESHNRDGLRGLNLPPEVLRKVYWENAVRLYRLDD
jgi:predicted TIM-barrel fold metal-dependent hydrolase